MNSDNGFLSQDEIDSLLNGGDKNETQDQSQENVSNETKMDENKESPVTDTERDLLGEIGNISMGSASTALSTIIANAVNITKIGRASCRERVS